MMMIGDEAVYSIVLVINMAGALTYFILVSQHGNPGYAGRTFGLSILYAVVFAPCSFVCWYRPLYKAFRFRSSFIIVRPRRSDS